MAKATTIKVKLVSSADTGFYYVTRKNSRTMTDKLTKKKYDPVAKKHVEFREVQDQVSIGPLCEMLRKGAARRFSAMAKIRRKSLSGQKFLCQEPIAASLRAPCRSTGARPTRALMCSAKYSASRATPEKRPEPQV